jgi:hypothetical protein
MPAEERSFWIITIVGRSTGIVIASTSRCSAQSRKSGVGEGDLGIGHVGLGYHEVRTVAGSVVPYARSA